MNPNIEMHNILKPVTHTIGFGYGKQYEFTCHSLTKCKALPNIFAGDQFTGLLKANFAAFFLAITMHCKSKILNGLQHIGRKLAAYNSSPDQCLDTRYNLCIWITVLQHGHNWHFSGCSNSHHKRSHMSAQ
jgi:hypothetical protein